MKSTTMCDLGRLGTGRERRRPVRGLVEVLFLAQIEPAAAKEQTSVLACCAFNRLASMM